MVAFTDSATTAVRMLFLAGSARDTGRAMSQESNRGPEPLQAEPMAPETAELIRRSYDAFNRRDLDALLALYHPACVWDMTHFEGWPDTPVYQGHEGLRRLFKEWHDAWDEVRTEPSDLLQIGGRLMVTCNMQVRGGASGAGVSLQFVQVAEAHDGLFHLIDNYSDKSQALEAVGLRE
jgi:ketosteroid isomerase-like protein